MPLDMIIDLTSDDNEEGEAMRGKKRLKRSETSPPSSPSNPLRPVQNQVAVAVRPAPTYSTSPIKPKLFSSFEIKALSASRIQHTRLPDLLQFDQKRNVLNASHPHIFIGWIQEHEESSAKLTLTNVVDADTEPVPAADFMFTDGYVLSESLKVPTRRVGQAKIKSGCDCGNELGTCDPTTCACYQVHEQLAPNPWIEQHKLDSDQNEYRGESDIRGDFAYDNFGRLRPDVIIWPGVPIWECNSYCGCSEDCRNRVVQKGRTVGLDLYKSPDKGWGLRATQAVKAGTFVTLYAGELIGWTEAEDRNLQYDATSTTYMLDLDSHHIKRKLIYEPYVENQKQEFGLEYDVHDEIVQEKAMNWALDAEASSLFYSIDAGLWGNLSRFFNHSCDPTLAMYPVYTEERDIRRPFLAFFARRDIAEGEEMTFAYDGNGAGDTILQPTDIRAEVTEQLQGLELGAEITVKTNDKKHNLTSMKCGCGAANCRGAVFIRGE